MKTSFDFFVEKVAKLAGISKEEVEKRIEAKIEKLGGLISREGALQIVAAELLKTRDERLSISDLLPGMKNVKTIGKIVEIEGIRKYRKKDKELKVASFLLADSTDIIRVVLWDTNHISLIEEEKIKKGDVVEIENAYVRGDIYNREIHLTSMSKIIPSSITLENVVEKRNYFFNLISQLNPNTKAKIKAYIVQAFKPIIYNFCPICNKKVEQKCHEEIEKRVIFSFIADDGSGFIRCIAFKNETLKIFNMPIEEVEKNFEKVLGEEFWFEGRVRKNEFRDELEFVVENVSNVDVEELVEELQKI
jgi:signal peptidase I